jgi:hypothetical protein
MKRLKYYEVSMDTGSNYSSFVARFNDKKEAIEVLSKCDLLKSNLINLSNGHLSPEEKETFTKDFLENNSNAKVDVKYFELSKSNDIQMSIEEVDNQLICSLSYPVKIEFLQESPEVKEEGKPYQPAKMEIVDTKTFQRDVNFTLWDSGYREIILGYEPTYRGSFLVNGKATDLSDI